MPILCNNYLRAEVNCKSQLLGVGLPIMKHTILWQQEYRCQLFCVCVQVCVLVCVKNGSLHGQKQNSNIRV